MSDHRDSKCILIIAGEASGDAHGAKVVKAMRAACGEALFVCGIGGPALRAAGVRILMDASELAVVGITEVLSKLGAVLRAGAAAKRLLRGLKPDLLLLIDFPEFNLHIARTAKKLGVPILYYISPQIWAWRPGRIKKIAKRIDHMAVILPFEEDLYRTHGVAVSYVGHPLLDGLPAPAARELMQGSKGAVTIGLVPGSREKEIGSLLPAMVQAAVRLRRDEPHLHFVVSLASSVKRSQVESLLKAYGADTPFTIVEGGAAKVFEQAHLLVICSGTATLEAALAGVPMIIVYKVTRPSYWLGRMLIRVQHIGLVNLIAGKRVVPELIQSEASPENIAAHVRRILRDPEMSQGISRELARVRELLGRPGASQRVAAIALAMTEGARPDAAVGSDRTPHAATADRR
jgi:lipid-A-disaccharide synthase